ncbi:MAG: trigger factor family protein, partial [Flavobacteriales bacterium]|nr:trigger factor family protein [Flavobacteriales bacterium]
MNISKENKDALNAVITVNVAEADYRANVDKALENMRKNANIPGFRKGMVPVAMVKKQYGVPAVVEEVNKLIQTSLDKYIQDEKLAIFGQPLPVSQDNIDWEKAKDFTFSFEIGIIPEVKVDLAAAGKKLTHYTIKVSDEYVNDHINSLTKRFGKITEIEKVEANSDVVVKIEAEENGQMVQPGAYKQGIVVGSEMKDAKNWIGKAV